MSMMTPTSQPDIPKVREQLVDSLRPHLEGLDGTDVHQSYLVSKKNEFSGVRFAVGPFIATWLFSESAIPIWRDGAVFSKLELTGSEGKLMDSERRAA